MKLTANAADAEGVLPWRDMYRLEMSCQIIHDSLHSRPGWTREYLLFSDGPTAGTSPQRAAIRGISHPAGRFRKPVSFRVGIS